MVEEALLADSLLYLEARRLSQMAKKARETQAGWLRSEVLTTQLRWMFYTSYQEI